MRTLGSVGVRHFRRGFGRFALTATGVVLGVAVLFAVQVANASASRSFERQVLAFARPTVSLQTPSRELPADVVATARSLDSVHVVSAFVGSEVLFADRERDGEPWSVWLGGTSLLRGTAFDETTAATFADRFRSEGDEPRAGELEVEIGDGLARELGVGVGGLVGVETPSGHKDLVVSRIFQRTDGEPVDFGLGTTVETAQELLARETFTGASILLADGTDVDEWITAHRGDFPPSVLLANAEPDMARFREFTEAMNRSFAAAALLSVFIGAFLIFLTLSMQVAERTQLYGMFRALGASRLQVARVVLAEALALGVVATALGLGLGLLVASGLTRLVADLYRIESASMIVTTGPVLLSVLVGIGVTLAGATIPALRAARLHPVVAMRRETPQPRPTYRLATFGAIAVVTGTLVAAVRPPSRNDPTLLVILGGAVLVLPLLLRPLAGLVGALTQRLVHGVGAVGVLHLKKEASRSAYTMGLVMVVLATVLTLGSAKHSFEIALDRIVNTVLGADVFAFAGNGFDDASLDRLRTADGMQALTSFREIPTRIATDEGLTTASIIVVDIETYFDVLGFAWVDGSDGDARRGLANIDEPGVVVGEIDATKLGLQVGDTLPLEASTGPVDFSIVGITGSLDSSRVDVFMGSEVANRTFGPGPASWIRAVATRGTGAEELKASINTTLGDRSDLTIRLGTQERADAARFSDRYFSIFIVVVLVALVVGLLGLANTLALAILRRSREIGVLRAIGTDRRHIAGMILVESLTLASAAAVLAVPLGALMAALVIKSVSAEIGSTIDFAFAWTLVPVIGVAAALLGSCAAWIPARRAARVEPVAALRFD